MKRLLLVSAILAVTTYCKAQDNLIGKTSQFLDDAFRSQSYNTPEMKYTDDQRSKYISYNLSKDLTYTFYFKPHDNICIGFKEILSKGLLIEVISQLNSNYNKISDNTWVSKDNTYSAYLQVFEGFFIVNHSKI